MDVDRARVVRRASAYLATMVSAVSHQGGHVATYRATLALVRGFQLDDADAYALLANEYNPRCRPAWSEKELRHKIAQAHATTEVGWGWLLNDPGRGRRATPPLPRGFALLPSDKSVPVVVMDDVAEARAYAGLQVRAKGAAPVIVTVRGEWHRAWAEPLRGRDVRVAATDFDLAGRILADARRTCASVTWLRPPGAATWAEAVRGRSR